MRTASRSKQEDIQSFSTEKALRIERNFNRAILETLAALVVVVELDGRVVIFNKACERATGYDFEDLFNRSVTRVFPPEEVGAVQGIFQSLLSDPQPIQHEGHLLHRDGSLRFIDWTFSVLNGEDGKTECFIGTGIDITEKRAIEQEACRRLDDLAHIHRLQTAGELSTMLAHELNQPLLAISSYSQACLLTMASPDPDWARLRTNLEQVGEQSLRAGRIIRQLREFVSRGRIDPVPVDLNKLVVSVRDLISPRAATRNVAVELDLENGLAPVLAVDVQIQQVLLNLIRNGVDSIRDAQMAEGAVSVQTRAQGDMALITVRDTGPGVSLEKADKLFEPFRTTKAYGIGVGLRISRSLVEAHDGKLWVEPGNLGGCFHFTLPFAP